MMSQRINKQKFLMTVLTTLLLVSVTASFMIKNGVGTCLSYLNDAGIPTSGSFVTTDSCDPVDYKQTNWVVKNLNISSLGPVVQFCINQTNYCVGIQKGPYGKYDNINLKIVANDIKDTTQQWIPIQSGHLPGHYVNGKTGGCAQAYTVGLRGGVINTVNCMASPSQQWIIVT